MSRLTLVLAWFVCLAGSPVHAQEAPADSGSLGGPTLHLSAPDLVRYPQVRLFAEVVDGLFSELSWQGVVLVIDRSGSMRGAAYDAARAAAVDFASRLGRQDSIALVTFADRPDFRLPFGADPRRARP